MSVCMLSRGNAKKTHCYIINTNTANPHLFDPGNPRLGINNLNVRMSAHLWPGGFTDDLFMVPTGSFCDDTAFGPKTLGLVDLTCRISLGSLIRFKEQIIFGHVISNNEQLSNVMTFV